MGYEEDYSIEIGQLSSEENEDYLDCCEVILSNLKRQFNRNEKTKDYIHAVERIAGCHQRAF